MTLNIEFSQKALDALTLIKNTNKNVFITGKAGTGKSTLLEYLKKTDAKKLILLAPTGISAINVGGDTIHSFFKLKPGFEKDEALEMGIDDKTIKRMKKIQCIAIDEISMVRADLLDAVDIFLRRARKNDLPFGGVQMLFFGDLYQLPPVVTPSDREKFYADYKMPYFFAAEVFKPRGDLFGTKFEMETIELDEIYRQSDNKFISLLNAVRDNSIDIHGLNALNTRFDPVFSPGLDDKYIHLMTTNAAAKEVNMSNLDKLPSKEISFLFEKTGEIERNLYPNDEEIVLKVGAQVMFILNDSERRWVNGTIGTVLDIVGDTVFVEKADNSVVEVKVHTWEISRYIFKNGKFEREIMGSFTQLPLKLAWAITIHKSQGKTFDKVIIDLGRGSFAHGQVYVALSRARSLDGVILRRKMYKSSIVMDRRVGQIMNYK